MFSSVFSRTASFRLALAALVSLAASACATTTPSTASSGFMALGEMAAPPAGLLALCSNGGLDCPSEADAMRAPGAPTGGGAKSNEANHPAAPAVTVAASEDARVDFAQFNEIVSINRAINSRIVWRADIDQYGQEEYWTLPLQYGLEYGDCEDFALEKRRALLEAGFPPAALALATVHSEATGLHAVLVVRTDRGDYVLDNTTPWVLPWQQAPYEWLSIQAGSLTRWRTIAPDSAA